MRGLEGLLREYGDFYIRHMDHADELGENILYRCGVLQGRVQEAGERDVILCPDMPRHLQRIDIALNRLPFAQKRAITNWYCAPLREDGRPYTKAQIAMKSRTSYATFQFHLSQGRRKLASILQNA